MKLLRLTERETGKRLFVVASIVTAIVEHEEPSRIIGEAPTKYATLLTSNGVLAVNETVDEIVRLVEGN